MATEVERKYDVPDGFAVPDLRGIGPVASVDAPETHDLDATYYDTADMRLSRAKATLRRRTGGHDAGWHLKRPAGAGAEAGDRSEISAPLGDEPPADLVDLVAAVLDGAPLRPIVRIRNRRRERALRDADGGVLALLADDEVRSEMLAGRPFRRTWREIEVELVGGSRSLLDEIQTRLYAAGAHTSPSGSKFARATRADPGTGEPLPDYMAAQVDAIDALDASARDGDGDAVHDMRVATRRLRATLRTFRSLMPRDRSEPIADDLRWLADHLGAVRDGDVLITRFDALAAVDGPSSTAAAAIRDRLVAERVEHRSELVAALDSDRYLALRRDLARLAEVVPVGVPDAALLRLVRRALWRADERLDHAVATPESDPGRDRALHDARKAYKRARYAVELVADVTGVGTKRLVAVQDVLGAHQDAVVAAAIVRSYADDAYALGQDTFGYGELHVRLRRDAGDRLAALPRARRRAESGRLRRRLLP
jgi:CHAD domain-containing protein